MSDPRPAAVTPDAIRGNWVERWAPARVRPFLRLARADRPIGTWLLLWPCWWSQALAELNLGRAWPSPWLLALFAAGAWIMRGAGCTYNDLVDRDYDARVARTRSRPIPSGQVSVAGAKVFMVLLGLAGLLVLLQMNRFTILLGIASLGLVLIYPFMKRITYWPQAVLGLTFKWGALMGWAAVQGSLALPALLLYAACIAWTLGYDTIYAHQDKEDDAMLGLKSTALRFGAATKPWLAGFYAAAVVMLAAAGAAAGAGWVFFVAVSAAAAQLAWQVRALAIDDPASCLKWFRSNREVGAIVFAGIVVDMALRAAVA